MCFGGGGGGGGSAPAPILPPAPKPIMPSAPPVAPTTTIQQSPTPIQGAGEEPSLRTKRSKRDQQGLLSKGSSQLRIPLNSGGGSGGLNL